MVALPQPSCDQDSSSQSRVSAFWRNTATRPASGANFRLALGMPTTAKPGALATAVPNTSSVSAVLGAMIAVASRRQSDPARRAKMEMVPPSPPYLVRCDGAPTTAWPSRSAIADPKLAPSRPRVSNDTVGADHDPSALRIQASMAPSRANTCVTRSTSRGSPLGGGFSSSPGRGGAARRRSGISPLSDSRMVAAGAPASRLSSSMATDDPRRSPAVSGSGSVKARSNFQPVASRCHTYTRPACLAPSTSACGAPTAIHCPDGEMATLAPNRSCCAPSGGCSTTGGASRCAASCTQTRPVPSACGAPITTSPPSTATDSPNEPWQPAGATITASAMRVGGVAVGMTWRDTSVVLA